MRLYHVIFVNGSLTVLVPSKPRSTSLFKGSLFDMPTSSLSSAVERIQLHVTQASRSFRFRLIDQLLRHALVPNGGTPIIHKRFCSHLELRLGQKVATESVFLPLSKAILVHGPKGLSLSFDPYEPTLGYQK